MTRRHGVAATALAAGLLCPATAERVPELAGPQVEVCLFGPDQVGIPELDVADVPSAIAGGPPPPPWRIVLRFLVVRRTDGTGGLDETLIDKYVQDANVGFRDTGFYFVKLPEITYIDDDSLYANIPTYNFGATLLSQHAQPGVMNHICAPTLAGGPPITGMNYVFNPRGNILAYCRIGDPDSIVYPPHEVGHVFFLYHPYETQFGAECTSGSNCLNTGDLLCETPASPAVHGLNTTGTGIFYGNGETPPCVDDPPYQPFTDLYMEAGWPAGHILRDRFSDAQVTRMTNTLFGASADLIIQRPDFVVDCNDNGLDDAEEILAGTAADVNRNMTPDECEIFPCPGDLLVAGMGNHPQNRVRYFDGTTGVFRETMWNGMHWAHQLRLGPDGLVYMTTLSIVQRLDLATGRTIDNFLDGVLDGLVVATDVLFEADGNLLVLANNTNRIMRYDGVTGDYLGVFANLPIGSPKYMEYGPEGDIFIVANAAGGTGVLRLDHETGASLGSFITPGAGGLSAGQGIVFHDGFLYVSNAGANNVLRYHGTSGDFIDEFVASGSGGLSNPHSLRFGPNGNLFVASRGDNSVKEYAGGNGAYLGDFVTPDDDELDRPAGLLFVPPKPGDLNGDNTVDTVDFLALLAAWGPNPGHPADLNGDDVVDTVDFLGLLAAWGGTPCAP